MATTTARFAKDRETKNAVLYQEEVEAGAQLVIGSLYIKKATFDGPIPEHVEVTVTWED